MSLPVNWVESRLGEVAEFVMGQAPPGAECNTDGKGTVFVKAGEFGPEYPVVREWTTRPLKLARKGDVLICVVGATCGKLNLAIDSAIGRSVAVIRPGPGIITKVVWYQLMPWVMTLRRSSAGSAQGVLTAKDLATIPFRVPPVAEQHRIVAAIEKHLSRLDAAVAALERVRGELPRYRAAVLKAACEGRLIEREAEPVELGMLLREPLRNGHSAKKATGNGGGIRTFTLSAVTNRDFSIQNTKLTVANPKRVRDLWAEPGDLFIERSNTPELVGTTALYRGQPKFAVFPDLLIRVRVKEPAIPEYVELVLRSETLRRYFRASAQGIAGSMPKIDQGVVSKAPIPLPSVPDQQRIVAEVDRRLSLADAAERVVSAGLAKAKRLRQAILKRAFEGKLVPQDPNDEPASVLLARIRTGAIGGN